MGCCPSILIDADDPNHSQANRSTANTSIASSSIRPTPTIKIISPRSASKSRKKEASKSSRAVSRHATEHLSNKQSSPANNTIANQSINSTNIYLSNNQPRGQSNNQSNNQSVNHSPKPSKNQSIHASPKTPISDHDGGWRVPSGSPIHRSPNHINNQSINQSVQQSPHHANRQSTNQSIKQSPNSPGNHGHKPSESVSSRARYERDRDRAGNRLMPDPSPKSTHTSSPSHSPSRSSHLSPISPFSSPFVRYQHSGTILGKGHFARVSLAYDNATATKVAIKIIDKKDLNKNRGIVESEISLLKRMGRAAHIVSLLDSYEDDAHFYLVMDLCSGGDLFSAIVESGKYSESSAARCCRQIAVGLSYMHSCGVTHRDLKPENILLCQADRGVDADIKLADFGLSRVIPVDRMMHTVCGTWAYCAPEVITHSPYTHAVDLWTLGVLMYILLAGYHPFDCFGDLPEPELLQRIVDVKYDFDDPVWRTVTPEAKQLIQKLIVHEPTQRMSLETYLQTEWITTEGFKHQSKQENTSLVPERLAKITSKQFRVIVTTKIAIARFRASMSRSPRTASRRATYEGSKLMNELDEQLSQQRAISAGTAEDSDVNDSDIDDDAPSSNMPHSSLSSLPFLTNRLDKTSSPIHQVISNNGTMSPMFETNTNRRSGALVLPPSINGRISEESAMEYQY